MISLKIFLSNEVFELISLCNQKSNYLVFHKTSKEQSQFRMKMQLLLKNKKTNDPTIETPLDFTIIKQGNDLLIKQTFFQT